ncbi:MAG: chorismate-binding protein [Gemmatimonadaceae bacterium]|jgi:anthranilate synthase component 1|nr:chorismate-binding protein [Gemmatimonadaceae bacterium]
MALHAFLDRVARLDRRPALVPVWRDCLLDTVTPVAAFARLREGPFAFLLESAPAGGETWARYTYLGTAPRAAWRLRDGAVDRWSADEGWTAMPRPADPLAAFEREVTAYPPTDEPSLGPFWSGAVGFFTYDAVRYIERLPHAPPRVIDAPDALFVFTDALVIIDNLRGQARVVCGVPIDADDDAETLRDKYEAAEATLERTVERLHAPDALAPLEIDQTVPPAEGTSSMSRDAFEDAVRRIKEYILAGDCFQALLARRIAVPHDFDGHTLYRVLRALNPSPYMYHLAFDGIELVGSSPELLVRLDRGRVTVRPIAGTRPRGSDAAMDAALGDELLADEKERAEHIMLVDLGRNDVGRIARIGSVQVTDLMTIERYSHVMHIVSQVEGDLGEGASGIDVFRATFPAGTMTGAPKVRAMEIIDELEPVRRGPYAGAVGFIAAGARRMDLAITIRTCVIADGVANVQAGGGIVADSDPAMEWAESENKARAMLTAIARARSARQVRAAAYTS